jgi:hypothetical protein
MNTGKAVDLSSFVAQRGGKDCVVAALATVIGRTYDEVANALGIPINAQTKQREVDRVDLLDTIYPLLRLGWLAAPLVAKEHADVQGSPRQSHLPTGDEIKAALSGVPAVIGYTDPDDQVGEHALARIIHGGVGFWGVSGD